MLTRRRLTEMKTSLLKQLKLKEEQLGHNQDIMPFELTGRILEVQRIEEALDWTNARLRQFCIQENCEGPVVGYLNCVEHLQRARAAGKDR